MQAMILRQRGIKNINVSHNKRRKTLYVIKYGSYEDLPCKPSASKTNVRRWNYLVLQWTIKLVEENVDSICYTSHIGGQRDIK